MVKKLFDVYKRWRHSRGFGVHSPYAFRFVTDVVRPGSYGFYAYDKLETLLKREEIHDRHLISTAEFLIRLAVFVKAKRLIINQGNRAAELASKSLGLPYRVVGVKESPEGRREEKGKIKKSRSGEKAEAITLRDGDLISLYGKPGNRGFSGSIDLERLQMALQQNIPILVLNPDAQTRSLLEKPFSYGLLFTSPGSVLLIPRPEMAYTSYEISLKIG